MIGRIGFWLLSIWIISIPVCFGQTWELGQFYTGGPALGIAARDSSIIWVLPNAGFPTKTTDGGTLWIPHSVDGVKLPANPGLLDVLLSYSNNNKLWVITDRPPSTDPGEIHLYVSTDDGWTWSQIGSDAFIPDAGGRSTNWAWDNTSSDILYIANHQDDIRKVDGTTITTITDPAGVTTIYDLKIANKDCSGGTYCDNVLLATNDGIWYSTDPSTGWTQASGTDNIAWFNLWVDLNNDDIVWAIKQASTGSEIYKSTDKGLSFSKWNTNNPGNSSIKPTLIAVNTDNKVCVTTFYDDYNGATTIYCSSDGGTWTSNTWDYTECVDDSCNGATWIRPRYLIAVGTDFWITGDHGPWKSTDGGATFAIKSNGYSCLGPGDMDYQGGTYNRYVTAAIDHAFWHSSDGLSNWTNPAINDTDYSCTGISVDSLNPDNIYLACGRRSLTNKALLVKKTTDGGTTWTNLAYIGNAGNYYWYTTRPHVKVSTTDSNVLIYTAMYQNDGSSGGIWVSTDGGSSWSVGKSGKRCYNIATDSSGNFYVRCKEEIYKASTTGLKTSPTSWTKIFPDADNVPTAVNPWPSRGGLAVDPNNESIIYAVNGTTDIVRSTDGGTTWTTAATGLDLRDTMLAAYNNAGSTELYLATLAWEPFSSPGGILKSTDGSTWTWFNDGLYADSVNHAYVLNDNVFLASDNGTPVAIYKLNAGGSPPPPPPSRKQAVATQAQTPPTIDGTLSDNIWSQATAYSIDSTMTKIGSVTDDNDLSGWFKVAWDSSYLYIAAEITDDSIQAEEGGGNSLWRDDGIEIYVDIDNDGSWDSPNFDHQFGIDKDGNTWDYTDGDDPFGVSDTAVSVVSPGYRVEMRVPWTELNNYSPAVGQKFGLDIAINDDDSVGGSGTDDRDGQEVWNCDGSCYVQPSNLGECAFSTGSGGSST